MTERDINGLLYQDDYAYRIGRKDGYDDIMSQMSDIIGKCYNTGYKDAMDFAIKWLQEKCSIEGRCIIKLDSLRKEMIENLCRETSN